jgi:DtxR family Mn-dependent transcriptional regulator
VGYVTPEYHPAFEEYCETIFDLAEDAVSVRQARIAERLHVSRPAVSEMIRRMEAEGLVRVDAGVISLSRSGRQLAEQVVRRHRLAERFLTDVLGLSWTEAHAEAGRWEHVISERVEAAMVELLHHPTTCPHGNPIPGTEYDAPASVPLTDVRPGTKFTVSRIPEELEFEPDMLEFLDHHGLRPGVKGSVSSAAPDGTTTVKVRSDQFGVGPFIAERLLVVPAGA